MTKQSIQRRRINVIVPTYRRPAFLRWTLRSILQQSVNPWDLHVYVVNNDRERAAVEAAVASALSGERTAATVRIVHRDPPLPPAESWIQAMNECARPGEVLIVHCDDDVMLPGSLLHRAETIAAHGNAQSVLLSTEAGMLLFDLKRERFFASRALRRSLRPTAAAHDTAVPGEWRDLAQYPGALFSCYTYLVTPRFPALLDQFRETIGHLHVRLQEAARVMIPINLAAVACRRGELLVDPAPVCARGMFLHEFAAEDGKVAWDAGHLYLATLAFLDAVAVTDTERAAMGPLRAAYERQAVRWSLRYLCHGDFRAKRELFRVCRVRPTRAPSAGVLAVRTWLGGILASRRLLRFLRVPPGAPLRPEALFRLLGFAGS